MRWPVLALRSGCIPALTLAVLVGLASKARAAEELAELSLEALSDVEVTSVSKTAESLRSAPASIYVITHDEIVRSGVTSIPEALRLAPNLQITRYSSPRYVAGARGFAGAEEAQNFSNKLLILIDGRSVYSPLFSGVYLDAQDVLLEDIDRIEVISGPGATLWGANAMHGVINIITRSAYLTQGALTSLGVGDQERSGGLRYGGKRERAAWRVYGKAFEQDAMELADGASAQDDWYKGQAGFRADWEEGSDGWTVQGDLYRAREGQATLPDVNVEGVNVLGRFQRSGETGQLQVQAYYDYTNRAQPQDGVAFDLHTYDVELQQTFALGAHQLIWGAGVRRHDYDITNSSTLLFEPHARELTLGNVFLQGAISLSDAVSLTAGLKLEHDSFSGWNPLPDLRLAWRVTEESLLWASASRAIRSPTPFDRDVVEKVGTLVFLTGNPSFDPERVDAFELGYRGQPHAKLSLSASVFYNVYDDLRTIEPAGGGVFLPLKWGNRMEGESYGLEAWMKWQAADWWRLAPGVRLLRKRLEFESGASEILGLGQSGNDPEAQALLTSSMNLGPRVTFDATLRFVDSLPEPELDSYYELNASARWYASAQLEISLTGFNLLDSSHQEYPSPAGVFIRRGVFAEVRWRL